MIVAVGATMGHDAPDIALVEAVERSKVVDDLTLEDMRRHGPRLVGHGVSGIVQVHHFQTSCQIPFVEITHLRLLVDRITEIGLLSCLPFFCPFIEFLESR